VAGRLDGPEDELSASLALRHEGDVRRQATSTIRASARTAIEVLERAGGIALSSVPSRYQHGSVFHAGGLDGVPANAAAAYGAALAAITAAVSGSTSAAKVSRTRCRSR